MSAIAPWWGQLCIGGFIGWLIVLAWAIARAAKRGDEQPARGEAEAQLPDFYSHLEPLSIGVELDKQAGRDRQVRGAGSATAAITEARAMRRPTEARRNTQPARRSLMLSRGSTRDG